MPLQYLGLVPQEQVAFASLSSSFTQPQGICQQIMTISKAKPNIQAEILKPSKKLKRTLVRGAIQILARTPASRLSFLVHQVHCKCSDRSRRPCGQQIHFIKALKSAVPVLLCGGFGANIMKHLTSMHGIWPYLASKQCCCKNSLAEGRKTS